MKKQLLILGLLASCGLQVQAQKKVMPRMSQPVDKDLLHVGLELKKAMNSDVFKKQLKEVVAEVFQHSNLSPSQLGHARASLSRVAKAMDAGYDNFARQRHGESAEIKAINEQLEPLRKQDQELQKQYEALLNKKYEMKDVQDYRGKNFDWMTSSKKIDDQLREKFPEYAKLKAESDLIEKKLEPLSKRQQELYEKLRALNKLEEKSLQPAKEDAQKIEQELKKELSKWPVRQIFKLEDTKVFFEHARLIVNSALQALNQIPVPEMILPKQTADEIKKDLLDAGLKIKATLTIDSVKQKIKMMARMAVDQANINTEQARKTYKSLMLISRALQRGVDFLMPVQRQSEQVSPQKQAIIDELDKLRKERRIIWGEYMAVTRKWQQIKGVMEEMTRLYSELKDDQEKVLKSKFPDYAQLKEQLRPYEEQNKKIRAEMSALWKKRMEVLRKERAEREAQKQPKGHEVVAKELQTWPFEQIVQLPDDMGIVLEHARLIIEAAGKVLERKAMLGTGVAGPQPMPEPEPVAMPAVQVVQ